MGTSFEKGRGRPRGESGQALVESAIALPLVIVMMAAITQLGWIAYCDSCVSSALAHAQYSLTASDLASGISADELVYRRMVDASPVLASGTLKVSGAKLESVDSKVRTVQLADADFDAYRFATKNEMTVRAKVTADIDYTPAALFGVVPEMHFVRHVQSSKVVDERFELG